MTIRHSSY